jgi:DNA-binding transcriptional MerR regulator
MYFDMTQLRREAEKALGITVPERRIHYFVAQGLLPPPRRVGIGGKGVKGLYDETCVFRIRAITVLRRYGYSVNEIRRISSSKSTNRLEAALKEVRDRAARLLEKRRAKEEERYNKRMKRIDSLLAKLKEMNGSADHEAHSMVCTPSESRELNRGLRDILRSLQKSRGGQ